MTMDRFTITLTIINVLQPAFSIRYTSVFDVNKDIKQRRTPGSFKCSAYHRAGWVPYYQNDKLTFSSIKVPVGASKFHLAGCLCISRIAKETIAQHWQEQSEPTIAGDTGKMRCSTTSWKGGNDQCRLSLYAHLPEGNAIFLAISPGDSIVQVKIDNTVPYDKVFALERSKVRFW